MNNTLFEPMSVGHADVMNRFIRSATWEGGADKQGRVTPELIRIYERLGKGGIGIVIPGYMSVSRAGMGPPGTMGIFRDDHLGGLTDLAAAIQAGGSRAIFQIQHSGTQTSMFFPGRKLRAPSGHLREPLFFGKPKALLAAEIRGVIADFAQAARRAKRAGADGVQIHAAHGYLLSAFLSPFFNQRTDEYGGSEENRYRLLGEVIRAVRDAVGDEFIVAVKMNVDDGTPKPGVTPELAVAYAGRLSEEPIDLLEISAGSTHWAPFVMSRGEVPAEEISRAWPWPLGKVFRRKFQRMDGKAPFREGYNAQAASELKRALGDTPLAVVGGNRTLAAMTELVQSGQADLVALCRPLIRQPHLVRKLAAGKAERAACSSCNRCLAAVFTGHLLGCYVNGVPDKPRRTRAPEA